ncbi:MAG: hypothetical protein K6T30_09805 [Alicyclobacillus sp.]|nr:hypothetical protein [Alicyclobacillus sp.]
MARRFWRAFIGLACLLTAFTALSWMYIVTHEWQAGSAAASGRLVLPTDVPSMWNLVALGKSGSFLVPVVVLVVQVWLTGGFYGTLIRANAGLESNAVTFASDGFRVFWRLLLWNLLWSAAALVVLGFHQVLPVFAAGLNIVFLLLRFACLFVDVALVAERDVRFALQSGIGSLFQSWLAMLPFAVVLFLLTGTGSALAASVNGMGLLAVAVVYVVAVAWVLHMVTSRYLYVSNWWTRQQAQAA